MFKSQATKDLEAEAYEVVAQEIKNGSILQGLWAQALAETNGNKSGAESRYIQLRMEQLKREVMDNAKEEKIKESIKTQDETAIQDVLNIPKENSTGFKFVSIFLFGLGGVGLTLIPRIGFVDDIAIALFLVCIFLVPTGIYAFYLSFKIEKETNVEKLKKQMNTLFWIMIPGSLVLAGVGIFSIIIAFVGIIMFFRYLASATMFSTAIKRVQRRGLLKG